MKRLIKKSRKLKRLIVDKIKTYKKRCKASNAFFDDFHKRIYDAVKRQLDDFDAYSLLAIGAPNDEFEFEAKNITKKIRPNMSVDQIAVVMADEMKFSFGDNQFTNDKFLPYAQKVHENLTKQ